MFNTDHSWNISIMDGHTVGLLYKVTNTLREQAFGRIGSALSRSFVEEDNDAI